MTELREVRLVGLPVRLHAVTTEHADALQREFELIRRADPDARSAPARLLALIEEVRTSYQGFGEEAAEVLGDALARDEPSVDVTYRIPAGAADAARRLDELLDEADEYCRQGEHLLTLVTPPDALRYRRWFLAEFVRQLEGGPPVPWRGDAAGDAAGSVPSGAPAPSVAIDGNGAGAARTVVCRGEIDAVSAPDLRELLAEACASEPERLTIDLTRATFIDSVGVSVLLAAHARLAATGGATDVVASPIVARTLSIMQVDTVIDVRVAEPGAGSQL
jgi:anti-anti-sigma factor